MVEVIDNVLLEKEIFNLYNGLINSDFWHLARSSTGSEFGTFPGVSVKRENELTRYPYWEGYFNSLFERIRQKHFEKYNYTLPSKIRRIHLGAKNDAALTDFHCDTTEPNTFTIVGFLTPQWSKDWGGQINVEGQEIEIKPGLFVIFKNNCRHNGFGPKKPIPYWRISLNYVIEE